MWLCCDKYRENKADREQDNYSLALRVHYRDQPRGTFSVFIKTFSLYWSIVD